MASLATIHEVGPDRISVDAGARWSTVVAATLAKGVVPPVLPDYLELSVGGTLSAGGISGASHRHGCLAATVYDLDVVTPAGELLTCSPAQHAGLFDAVRGTQGRHGIITRATVALTAANTMARRYRLTYPGLGTFLADQQRLIESRQFDHVDGQAHHHPGSGWHYILEAVTTFTPPDEPALPHGLTHQSGTEEITSSYRDFLHRLAPVRAMSPDSWQHDPHPRCILLLPGRHARQIIADVLSDLTPDDIGATGSILIYPIPTERLAAPRMPKAGDATTVVFGLQRTAPPGDPETLGRMRRANAALRATVEHLGGASYASHPDIKSTVER
jgi:hypothetical protein